MKRYEKMSKEEIIKFISKNSSGKCCDCEANDFCDREGKGRGCSTVLGAYLSQEVPKKTVSRWQTIKSDEDCRRMISNYITNWCSSRYRNIGDYFLEKIEVEDDDIRRSY